MNRREFLGWVGVGSLASSLPVALAACTPKATSESTDAKAPQANSSAGATSADGYRTIGTVAELDKNGELLSQPAGGNPALVIRDPNNAAHLLAVNPTCTHAGCTVDWKQDQKAFVCPCHGSVYAPDGSVIHGPAQKPLSTYAAKQDGDRISVKA